MTLTRTRVGTVPGTHAADGPGEWWPLGSPFARYLSTHACDVIFTVPWSCDLDGVFWEGGRRHEDWKAGGRFGVEIAKHLPRLDADDPGVDALIVHSYGLYVALHMAAWGVRIPVLVSIGSPIRRDLGDIVAAARPNIGDWLHIFDRRWDWMAFLGQVGDRVMSFNRKAEWKVDGRMVGANQQAPTEGINHSRLLNDPRVWPLWETQGYLDLVREPARQRDAARAAALAAEDDAWADVREQ